MTDHRAESVSFLLRREILVLQSTGPTQVPQGVLYDDLYWKNRCLLAVVSFVFVLAMVSAGGQTAAPAAGSAAAPAIQLAPYTAADQSASVGVPPGWKVTYDAQTVITMTGPQKEIISLGNTVVAKNAASAPGQQLANGINMSMPYSATLAQKFTMILQQSAAASGKSAPQVTIDSTTPLQLPAAIGECGRIVADVTGDQGATKVMAIFCSLPVDSGGTYKNIMLLAQAFVATAAQDAATAQAVFQATASQRRGYRKSLPHLRRRRLLLLPRRLPGAV